MVVASVGLMMIFVILSHHVVCSGPVRLYVNSTLKCRSTVFAKCKYVMFLMPKE